ncbi:MarR family winged helix-turn-helix transcriptional regulator [Demequina aurantiaca]|uniref:MarR family winged helix-turn-helix transcriptional regulator n=1 Tax=Demequina aurantiaca TaxID=676200 RepID=UPI003D343F10
MSRRVMSAVEARLQADAGISSADLEILAALDKSPGGTARAKDLGEMLSWEKSRISHQVTRMVDRGLLQRTECDQDLRGSWVQQTTAGRDALALALPHYGAAVREVYLNHLGDGQASSLALTALQVVAASTPDACRAETDEIGKALAP